VWRYCPARPDLFSAAREQSARIGGSAPGVDRRIRVETADELCAHSVRGVEENENEQRHRQGSHHRPASDSPHGPAQPRHDQDAVQLAAVIVAWLAGDMVRAVRGYRQQLQLVQRRRAVEELQLAQAEERLRVSREVHDVVSHSLSAIAVQAGVARLVFAGQSGPAGAALSQSKQPAGPRLMSCATCSGSSATPRIPMRHRRPR